ncbi:MAG TPA: 2-C-methyl-D-erythritol 2,4-cyclodiphosphate synthase [Methylomirabilota bacterium]|nr:2-C-methyl-D-erythritol 2,4-cyclodiphosphate synthase [Methylomirabilota bacterium]
MIVGAVLVAAGSGRRMGGEKLWIEFSGRPAWRWGLDTLLSVPGMSWVVVVAPEGSLDRFRDAIPESARARCEVVAGGEERADSALAGIVALTRAGFPEDAAVLIHDAARPAASSDLMERILSAVTPTDGAVPVVPLHDSLKHVDNSGRVVGAFEREGLALAQTPQAATLVVLRAALEEAQAWGRKMTDEAAAFGAAGIVVRSVPGEPGNIKLTEPGDEALVASVLADRSMPLAAPAVGEGQRAGVGFDAHRFGDEGALRLGGVEFRGEPRLVGHSDGDAGIHAVIDALLGAAAAGDIGSLFPPDDPHWQGADSGDLLRRAVSTLAAAGWRPVSVDLTIVAARPEIAPRRADIAARIGELCGIDAGAVGVKGTTSDGLGFVGAEGIAAFAVAVVAHT